MRFFENENRFLDASTHLYKRECPSEDRLVGRLVSPCIGFVGRSVCWSVRNHFCSKTVILARRSMVLILDHSLEVSNASSSSSPSSSSSFYQNASLFVSNCKRGCAEIKPSHRPNRSFLNPYLLTNCIIPKFTSSHSIYA